jgi:hypothetical protein
MSSPLAIDVATNEKGLGVIKAYCSKCRQEMQYSNEKLMCLNCGNIEERKWFEAEQKPREFAPRGGGVGSYGSMDRGPRREGGFRPQRNGGFRPRREGGSFGGGHARSFGEHHGTGGFGNEEIGFGRDRNREPGGREFRRQGQGFGGHQNKPQQRW